MGDDTSDDRARVSATLELDDVAGYLLERDLIEPASIVDGGLRIVDHSRRNRVFVVTARGGPCFVVKQARAGVKSAVTREGAVLERILAAASGTELVRHLPAVVVSDTDTRTIVFETHAAAHDLARHHRYSARGRFSRALAQDAGRMLARLHALSPDTLRGVPAGSGRGWGLRVHRLGLEELWTLSAAEIELVGLVQRSAELCAALDELGEASRDDSLIHGDVRWENCLALQDRGGVRRSRMALIDWELAGTGDRCVDIGAFLADYLRMWVRSIPLVAARDPSAMLDHARFPLARMQPALRSFWAGYVRTCGPRSDATTLHRATRFAAVRLVEAAFEEAATRQTLRPGARIELQLAANILRKPRAAAARLLGIDTPSPVTR